ncbi:MAG: Gfo/Idh/MocA family protein [Planctomycetota bacterium]|jgi:predicted dehydrogenase
MKDSQIKIGLIGCGGRGFIAHHAHKPDENSAVTIGYDINPEGVNYLHEHINNQASFTTEMQELLDQDIDAVIVASPDYCHHEQAIAAMQAGKHVYLEKPMGITIEQCDEMMKVSEETGMKLMIGFNMRYMTFINMLKERIERGDIGELKAIWVRHFVGMGGRYYFHDWHGKKENCTSLLLQKGSHDYDAIHYITGQYTRRVSAFGNRSFFGGDKPNDLHCTDCPDAADCPDENIETEGNKKGLRTLCAYRQEIDIEDNYTTMLELNNGIIATYNECHFSPEYNRNYCFIGTEGRLENCELKGEVYYWNRDGKGKRMKEPTEIISTNIMKDGELEVGHGGADPKIMKAFVDMLVNDTEPPVPMRAGRESVAVGCMADDSIRTGNVNLIPEYKS